MSVFVIAEAGVNHNGSEELAMRLIEVAAEAGAGNGDGGTSLARALP